MNGPSRYEPTTPPAPAEEEQRDARQQHAVAELSDEILLAGLLHQVRSHRAGIDEAGCEDRPQQQPAEVGGDFVPGGRRAVVGAELAATQHVEEAGKWRKSNRHAVRADGLGADHRQ